MDFTHSQRQAIEFKDADLIISAGAGSGKTATLTGRIIEGIQSGEDISKKLIVTFTKAASNELRARISKALSALLAKEPNNRHISEQIVKLEGADICTIDSFCMKIVRPNFDKIGISPNFVIADENEVEVLCRESISEVIDTFYDEKEQNPDFLIVCDCFSDLTHESVLEDALLNLYKKLITTPDSISTLLKNTTLSGDFMHSPYGKVLSAHIESFLSHFHRLYLYMINEIGSDEKAKKAYIEAFSSDLDFIILLENAISSNYEHIKEIFCEYSPKKLGQIRGECSVDTDFLKEMRQRFKDAISKLKKEYFSTSSDAIKLAFEQNKKICSAIYEVLFEFEKVYSEKKKLFNVCDFNDISRFALSLLYNEDGSLSDIAKDISEKYDEIYIDEYQDTNSVQDKIFKAVSKNNRFMVGDIKQSIYRFRSAEPEIFSSYRNSFSEIEENSDTSCGKSVFMSENFRCDKHIIEFSNCVSDFMFGNSNGIPYCNDDKLIFSKNVGNSYIHQKVQIALVKKDSNDSSDNDDDIFAEAEFVALEIKKLIDNGYLPSGKKIIPSDIAILLRGYKSCVEKYILALEKYGVKSEYSADERFFEKSEILLMLCILNAIDNPLKDVFLAGAMRSDLFGFSLEDLVKIRASSKNAPNFYTSVKEYSGNYELEEKIKGFFEKLEKYRAQCRKKNTYEIISMIFADTGIMSSCSENERKNLLKLYDFARGYEGDSYKGLYSFLRHVEKISESASKEQLGSLDNDSVKIMSIHASKGLEFEVCFIASAHTKFNTIDTNEPILFDRALGISGFIGREGGVAKFNTIMRKCASLSIKKSSVEEEMRTLYVAMTRAKSILYITALGKKPNEALDMAIKLKDFSSEYSVLSSSSYIDWILNACCQKNDFSDITIISSFDDFSTQGAKKCTEQNHNYNNYQQIKEILEKRFSFEYPYGYYEKIPSKLSISKLYPQILDGTENDEITLDVSLDDAPLFLKDTPDFANASEKGTATHVFLQFCDFEKLLSNGAESELERLVSESFISKESAKLVNLKHIEIFAKSELFKSLLNAKSVLREFRFNIMLSASDFSSDERLKNESVLVQGVTDCIFENENNELILVDYKTDRVSYENYKEELLLRHSSQLTYYKKACERIFERRLSRVLIYSVPLGKTVELP